MAAITKYYSEKTLLGIKISSIANGSIPLTPSEEPLQIIGLRHKKGAYLKAHAHAPKERITHRLQECIVMKKGKIKIDLYGPDKKFVQSVLLREGQLFLSVNGGIGIHVTQDCEMFEFKNGPFVEDKELI